MSSKISKNLQLVLSILNECRDIDDITEMKLYKLMYYAEANYYEENKEKLTSSRYIKNTLGPTPCYSPEFFKELKKYVDIVRKEDSYLYYYLKNGIDTASLTKDIDNDFIRENTKKYKYLSATDLSKLTHQDAPFLMSKYTKTINIENVLYRDDEESDPDELKKEQGLFKKIFNKENQKKASNKINNLVQGCNA